MWKNHLFSNCQNDRRLSSRSSVIALSLICYHDGKCQKSNRVSTVKVTTPLIFEKSDTNCASFIENNQTHCLQQWHKSLFFTIKSCFFY